jgi:hypothetical protein
MADLKISQLTSASTPLTGSETLPVVQSSSTKKVTVSDLTVGRAVELGRKSFTRSDGGTTSDTTNGFKITPSTANATDSFYRLETGTGVLIGAYGNVGDELSIWTRDTANAVMISQNGNMRISAAGKGLTLKSPDGLTTKTVTINNLGVLVLI